jgi:hypothetical protein
VKNALVAIAGVLASFGVMYAICFALGVNSSPAILAAAIAVGLSRRPEYLDPRTPARGLIVLPAVALAAGLVGLAFRVVPLLGAALFCAGIALSIWLRNFGERGSAIGRTIALPFIAMLVVPVHVDSGRPWLGALLVILAGAIAFVCASVVQRVA